MGNRAMKRRFRPAEHDGTVFLRSKSWNCPICAAVMDSLGVPGKTHTPQPNPGDASLCIKCGQILVFDALLNLVVPDPALLLMMRLKDPQFSAHVDRLQAAHRSAFPPH